MPPWCLTSRNRKTHLVAPGNGQLSVSVQNLHLLHILALLCHVPSLCWQSMGAIPFETRLLMQLVNGASPLIPRQHSPLLGSRCLSTLIDPPSSGMILTRASLPTIFSYFLFLSPLVQLRPAVCQVSWPYHAANRMACTHSRHHVLVIPLLILFPFLTFSLYLYFPLSFGPPSW